MAQLYHRQISLVPWAFRLIKLLVHVLFWTIVCQGPDLSLQNIGHHLNFRGPGTLSFYLGLKLFCHQLFMGLGWYICQKSILRQRKHGTTNGWLYYYTCEDRRRQKECYSRLNNSIKKLVDLIKPMLEFILNLAPDAHLFPSAFASVICLRCGGMGQAPSNIVLIVYPHKACASNSPPPSVMTPRG